MANVGKRLDDLERALEPDDKIQVNVDWHGDGLVEDRATGERVTPDEWRRRYPDEQLILVGWNDDLEVDDDDD